MYGNQLAPMAETAIDHKPPTVSERLAQEKQRLEERLAEVNAAIDALDGNPEAKSVVDALSKLGHF